MDILKTHRPELSNIDAHYRDDILPDLIAKDMTRRRLVKKFAIAVAIIIPVALLCAAVGFKVFGTPWAVIIPFGLAAFAVSLAYKALGAFHGDVKLIIVGRLCRYLGWSFAPKGFDILPLETFLSCKLLPKSDKQSFEDCIHGAIQGADFVLHEAHLQRRQRSGENDKWVTVFRGVLIRVAFPRGFLGTTLLLRDAGFFNSKKKSGLKRVGLVDPVFEKIFEAYGSDQVEARYLLTPTFMQRLVDLEKLLDGKKLRAAFTGGELLVAVEAPNQFEPGSMFTPLTDISRTQKVIDEISTVLDIVEIVNQR